MPRTISGLRRRQSKAINSAYNDLIKELSNIYSRTELKEGNLFILDNQPKGQKRRATEAFRRFRKRIIAVLEITTDEAWGLGSDNYKKLLKDRLNRVKNKISTEEFARQMKAIENIRIDYAQLSFYKNRKIAQTTISDRVWDIQNLAKQNIEMALTEALSKGLSAQELARRIRRNLNEPDKLFRRVKDETGKWRESKNMKAYKPGRGVYKSAHKNALRLARNEINKAYRESEQAQMLKNQDVVGQRIRTSHSHNVEDMCDILAGDYPVDFLWDAWHVNCMCHRQFIMKTDEEFIAEIKSKQTLNREASKNFIRDVPSNFKRWVSENSEAISRMKRKPEFLTNNGY